MADHKESDLIALIFGVLIVAISGIAVGLASSTPPAATDGDGLGAPAGQEAPAAPQTSGNPQQGPGQ